MFEKIRAHLNKQQAAKSIQPDVSQLNDSVALKAEWHPLKSGGASFKTNNLVKLSSSVYRYQLSNGGKLFLAIFGFIGLIFILFGLTILIIGKLVMSMLLLGFGLIFCLISYSLYKVMAYPKVFDASLGIYWVGHRRPKLAGNRQSKQQLVYFSEIHALQVLSKRVRSKNGSFTCYEINLVLNDGLRLNLVNHGNYAEILADAVTLSALLSKPVWNTRP